MRISYGPVSRKALRHLLEENTITPNTLVRHCTQREARPAADQPAIMEHLSLDTKGTVIGDRLSEAWPAQEAGPAGPGGRLASLRLA